MTNRSFTNTINPQRLGAVVLLKEEMKDKAFFKLGRIVASIVRKGRVSLY